MFKVAFEIEGGTQGNGYAAIDEINFNAFEDCPTLPANAQPTTPGTETTQPSRIFPNCDFEDGRCSWILVDSPWNWRRYLVIQ